MLPSMQTLPIFNHLKDMNVQPDFPSPSSKIQRQNYSISYTPIPPAPVPPVQSSNINIKKRSFTQISGEENKQPAKFLKIDQFNKDRSVSSDFTEQNLFLAQQQQRAYQQNFNQRNLNSREEKQEKSFAEEQTFKIRWTFLDGTYKGEQFHGMPHGIGTQTFLNGVIHEGQWANGRPNGIGKRISPNGALYEGEWANGMQHGRGKYIFANGAIYEGEWVNGMQHGRGKYIFTNGISYEGEWINGMQHGKGRQIYPNGTIYEGEWINGKLFQFLVCQSMIKL